MRKGRRDLSSAKGTADFEYAACHVKLAVKVAAVEGNVMKLANSETKRPKHRLNAFWRNAPLTKYIRP